MPFHLICLFICFSELFLQHNLYEFFSLFIQKCWSRPLRLFTSRWSSTGGWVLLKFWQLSLRHWKWRRSKMVTASPVALSAVAQKVKSSAPTRMPSVWIWTESNVFLQLLGVEPWWASPNSSSSRGTTSQDISRLPGENTEMRIWRQMGIQRGQDAMPSPKTEMSSGATVRSMSVSWSEGSTTLFTWRLWQMPYINAKGGTGKHSTVDITASNLAFICGN